MSSSPAYQRAEPEARRASLIEACARVLARDGVAGASVRGIALEAGVSPGLVGHYFPAVDALYAAAYAQTEAQVAEALDAAVEQAGADPMARIEAYVTASFRPPVADPALLSTWIAFWSLVRSNAGIARQHAEQYGLFRARLTALLAAAGLPDAEQRSAAIALTALVDGLWLELCLSPQAFSADEAAGIARRALAAYFDRSANRLR